MATIACSHHEYLDLNNITPTYIFGNKKRLGFNDDGMFIDSNHDLSILQKCHTHWMFNDLSDLEVERMVKMT